MRLPRRCESIEVFSVSRFRSKLQVNSYSTELNLGRNMICDNGFSCLSSALCRSPNVTHLDISHNNGRPRGLKILFDFLKVCFSLSFFFPFSFLLTSHLYLSFFIYQVFCLQFTQTIYFYWCEYFFLFHQIIYSFSLSEGGFPLYPGDFYSIPQ